MFIIRIPATVCPCLALGSWSRQLRCHEYHVRGRQDKGSTKYSCDTAAVYEYIESLHRIERGFKKLRPGSLWAYTIVAPQKSGRWCRAFTWQSEGWPTVTNTAYRVNMARRYRFRWPVLAQAPKSCHCGYRAGVQPRLPRRPREGEHMLVPSVGQININHHNYHHHLSVFIYQVQMNCSTKPHITS